MNIKDIAKLAGVGVSTVSRVLNNHEDVKESTREKVLQVIKENNYVPNNSARILKQHNTRNIGVLVKGVFNPMFSEMTNIIGRIINSSQYTMILGQNDYSLGDDMKALESFIKEKKLQGVICLGGNFETVKKERLQVLNVPVVLTSVNTLFGTNDDNYSSVGIDNQEAAYDATKYLLDLGHENIAIMIGDENDLGISWSRLKGFKKSLEERGLTFDTDNILVGDYNASTAYTVMKSFLKKRKDITAIFSISDVMAIGIAKAIVETGYKIGDDISLIGFDGMDVSEFYNPGITTVKQPRIEMAETCASLILGLLNKKEHNQHLILKTELIKRDSCKKIKKNN